MTGTTPWEIEYFETPSGRVPVLEWIEQMTPKERAPALLHIEQLALLGTEARPPLVKSLGGKLYELRWKARDKQHRIAYVAAVGRRFVLLHGFIKKSRTTSREDLELARNRMREYERSTG